MTTIQVRTQRERFRISGFGSGTTPDEVEASARSAARLALGGFTGKLELSGTYHLTALADIHLPGASAQINAAAEAGHTIYATIYFAAITTSLVTEVKLS